MGFLPDSPEARARRNIDKLLSDAGWIVQSRDAANVAAGVIEAAKEGLLKSLHPSFTSRGFSLERAYIELDQLAWPVQTHHGLRNQQRVPQQRFVHHVYRSDA